jgi:DNA-directed RNA polymerase specialized sigma24 family protein
MSEATTQILLDRFRNGDEQAAAELVERFTPRLLAVIRSYLSPRVKAREDEEDVLQSVFRCLFDNARHDRVKCPHSGDLWKLLVVIAVRKAQGKSKYHRARKRDVYAEQPLGGGNDLDALPTGAGARGPSPVDAADLRDEIEHLMHALNAPQRDIVAMWLLGHSSQEIADHFQDLDPLTPCYVAKVNRVLRKVKERLELRRRHFEHGSGPREE